MLQLLGPQYSFFFSGLRVQKSKLHLWIPRNVVYIDITPLKLYKFNALKLVAPSNLPRDSGTLHNA
jgi:hypothetical protein